MITLRLTRQQAITIESLLRTLDKTDLRDIEGFNKGIGDSGIRPLRPMTTGQVAKLVARLEEHE